MKWHEYDGINHSRQATLESSDRTSDLTASPPVDGFDGERRALIGLAAADGIPCSGEEDAGDEDDGRVIHVLECDGESRGHGEERDGEADPGWKGKLVLFFLVCGISTV
jgi:hypothetical protein